MNHQKFENYELNIDEIDQVSGANGEDIVFIPTNGDGTTGPFDPFGPDNNFPG